MVKPGDGGLRQANRGCLRVTPLWADAEEDGAIVPIIYEGRIAEGALIDADDLEDAFAEYFPKLSEEDYDQLQQRYATTSDVLSADSLILKKARDMLNHYVSNVMPNGFKARWSPTHGRSRSATGMRYLRPGQSWSPRLSRESNWGPHHGRRQSIDESQQAGGPAPSPVTELSRRRDRPPGLSPLR